MKNLLILILCFISLFTISVSADTYVTNTNLFENSYSNNLIDMAKSQIDNFLNKKYIIFQNDYDYYLVSSDDITLSSNYITARDSNVISAIRSQSGYNYYYSYSISHENTTTITLNNIIISNFDTNYSISSKRFEEYSHYSNVKNLGIFILGLCFAMFLLKERSYL